MGAYDCAGHPNPHQVVKVGGTIQLVELDMLTGAYTSLYTFASWVKYANAIALNPTDGIAYGKFTDGFDQDFLCRFSADPVSEPMECLCALSTAANGGINNGGELNSATIVNDVYYVGMAAWNLRAVTGVSSLRGGSSGAECPGSWIFGSRKDGFGGRTANSFGLASRTFDVSALGLGIAALTAQFGWNERLYGNERYLKQYAYDSANDLVTSWKPRDGGNTFLDINPFVVAGITYLVGLGAEDGALLIVKLSSPTVVAGYAFARARVDWQGAAFMAIPTNSGSRGFKGFGAAFQYGSHLYFAANGGTGVFKVDTAEFSEMLWWCDFTAEHACGLAAGRTVKLWRVAASAATYANDGMSCVSAIDPFAEPPSPPLPPPVLPPLQLLCPPGSSGIGAVPDFDTISPWLPVSRLLAAISVDATRRAKRGLDVLP